MMDTKNGWRRLEINGGRLHGGDGRSPHPLRLQIPAHATSYSDAQIDDYAETSGRRSYPWRPGTTLSLHVRFSHPPQQLQGTAGFGFWNAPFGDPTVPLPTLPRATWFFWGSPPNHLPFFPDPPGHGGFAGTIDASRPSAILLAPFAPLVLLLQNSPAIRRRLWPWVQRRLQITHTPIPIQDSAWHQYRLDWRHNHCTFWVDDQPILHTPASPRGKLGFVCWIDNQFLRLTPWGVFRWGTLSADTPQWCEVADIQIAAAPKISSSNRTNLGYNGNVSVKTKWRRNNGNGST